MSNTSISHKNDRRRDPTESGSITLMNVMKRFLSVLWGTEEHSVQVYRHIKEASSILGDIPIKDFSNEHIEILLRYYKEKGNKVSTINRKLSSLSKLVRHSHRLGLIHDKPFFPFRKEKKGRVRFLSKEEEEKILSSIKARNYLEYSLVIFLLDTGARMGEALSLTYDDIDFNSKTVSFWETKTNSSRTVYLTDRAVTAVQRKCCTEGPFKAINRWTFRKHWDKAKIDAGLKDDNLVVPHVLRHTCASRLVQGGVDIRRVKEWLGHKTIEMTLRYSHLSPKDLKMCVDVLDNKHS